MSDDFPLEILIVGLSSLTAITVAAITVMANKDRRSKLLSDLDILHRLEVNSDARLKLQASIDQRVLGMADLGEKTRNVFGTILGLLFLVIGGTLIPLINSLGGWWLLLHVITLFFLLFGVVGVATSWGKVPRDEKGNAIKTK